MLLVILLILLLPALFLKAYADEEILSGNLLDNFDGPQNHEVLLGGIVDMPCVMSVSTKKLLFRYFTSNAGYWFQLKWVHKRWNNLVEPWVGDGRRSYKVNKLLNSLSEIGETRIQKIPKVAGISLQILSTNPLDHGLYACLLSRGVFTQGLRMDLSNATLLSIHSLRVMEGTVFDKTKVEAIDKNSIMGTFFDAWTWQLYKFKNAKSDDIIHESRHCFGINPF